jgi:UDP-N-acetylglucosamine diphosphorylase / glucose-1-phosphate thymidylyltransferase / UDP-N-acetylgalactosamine diphosphorylase / glucosamine-1-phosphate N-acetyltransferase / galactosamine-1-phosphate N-acetyltransferase
MLRVVLRDSRQIRPFNELARDLRIRNTPLWLLQRDLLAPHSDREIEIPAGSPLPDMNEPMIVYQDNLVFDQDYIESFIYEAQRRSRPSRAAFSINDPAFREHCLPLSNSYEQVGSFILANLWYYPEGPRAEADPLILETRSIEAGYYHIPTHMGLTDGDLTFQVPKRGLIAIDSWVHIYVADIIFGLWARGARFEERLEKSPAYKLRILFKAMLEGKQVLECSDVVQIGRNCVIDPTAVIHGPTTIGDNCTIGAGVVIENSTVGNNVNISQGCQVMLSVVGDGCFLPFRAALFLTTLMENTIVAQNACLQACVIGRNTFIGAGTTFTDFNLVPAPIRALDGKESLSAANTPVLGGCVGHNCRIGSGLVIYPARTIESDVVIMATDQRQVIDHDIPYEESDHLSTHFAELHPRVYPRSPATNLEQPEG